MKQSKKELKNDFTFEKEPEMAKYITANRNLEVKKADALVNKARYKLSPLAIKFISVVIANLKRSDDINEEYILKVKDFKELTGQKTKRLYELIDEALNDLLKNPLTIPLRDEKNSVLKANWVSGAVYNEGEIRFMIYPKLRPFLLEVKEKYLKYRLENILSLKSGYVIRLYEILKDWFNEKNRYRNKPERIKSLDELREILEIPRSYQYSSHIKKLILEKAKVQFAEHTDIIFDYEEIKTGRKVTNIKFYIYPNPAKLEDENNKKSERIFKNRSAFVAFLRQNYAGTGKAFGYRTIERKKWWLKIDKKGLLYGSPGSVTLDEIDNLDSLTKEFNSVESSELYDLWFKIAQNIDLYKDLIINEVCLYELQKENIELATQLSKEISLLKAQGII